jgi:hypothetical protein
MIRYFIDKKLPLQPSSSLEVVIGERSRDGHVKPRRISATYLGILFTRASIPRKHPRTIAVETRRADATSTPPEA